MATDPSLHRTNINLYATDCDWLRRRYGWGWTERVREIIHTYINDTRQYTIHCQGYCNHDFSGSPKVPCRAYVDFDGELHDSCGEPCEFVMHPETGEKVYTR